MALVDYERVVTDLRRLIAEKPHHGSRDLAHEIDVLCAKHEIDETLPERMLRLYGVQFSEDLRSQARDELLDDSAGSAGEVAAAGPGHRRDRGGHDGSRNGRRAAGAAGP